MALVGTISGSNGTINSAVTGTLVIANQPGATFPVIPADTILYVSAALDLKDGTTPGVVTFATDTVHSGSSYYQAITTPGTTAQGRVFLDNSDFALSMFTETGVRHRLGRSGLIRAKNNDTATITKGSAVKIAGSVGSNLTVIRSISTSAQARSTEENQIIGIAAEDIAINAFGYICYGGQVFGLNFTGTEGGIIFVSSVTSGALTQTMPAAPYESIKVGTLIRSSATQGAIMVDVTEPIHLNDLVGFDTDPTTWANGSSIVYDSATSAWKSQRNGYILSGAFEATGLVVTGSTLQVKDASGNVVGSISSAGVISGSSNLLAGGNITGSNELLTGNLAVNGGSITSTAATFNLVNATATTVNFAGGASTALNVGNTAATNTVLGQTKFSQGLSGSLTKLTDGTSYLIAGSGVSISTGSSGAVTVSSTIPTGFASAMFGTGIDGDLTVVDGATTTATKETYYNNLTIQGSGSFKPAGFRIFVKGTLTISASGSFNDNGNAAVTSTPGGALAARGYLVGQTSAGGAAQSVIGNGVAAAASFGNCPLNDNGVLATGGTGGAAGARTGGGTNTLTAIAFSQNLWGSWQAGRAATVSTGGGNSTGFNGGGSGGSGGNDSGGGTVSGAGGGGAGIVWLAAQTISNSGKISANGGGGGGATGAGNAGGGGGGAGGSVTLITSTPVSSCGTVQAIAGGGGAGVGTGATGSPGVIGSTCIISFGGN